jgi:hypothetical protein
MAQIGQEYTPRESVKPRALAKLPPSPVFQYAHHPKGWQVMWDDKGAAKIVPRLNKIFFQPGTNHIGNDRGAGIDTTECKMRYESDGFVFIPFELAGKVDKGAASYLQRIDVHGGHAFLSRWVRPVPGTGRLLSDRAGWLKFLVVVSKYVRPAPSYALEDLKSQYERMAGEYARRANFMPDADERIAKAKAAVLAIDKELKKAEQRDALEGSEVVPNVIE